MMIPSYLLVTAALAAGHATTIPDYCFPTDMDVRERSGARFVQVPHIVGWQWQRGSARVVYNSKHRRFRNVGTRTVRVFAYCEA